MVRNVLTLFLLVFIFGGCGPKIVYEKKIDLHQGWPYGEIQNFTFDINDTVPAHDILLNIHHDADFFYQNIYTKVTTIFPNQKKVDHIISLNLTDEKNHWVGDCNSKKCEAELVLSENIYFNQTGTYQIILEQYGRTDSLNGVNGLHFMVVERKK